MFSLLAYHFLLFKFILLLTIYIISAHNITKNPHTINFNQWDIYQDNLISENIRINLYYDVGKSYYISLKFLNINESDNEMKLNSLYQNKEAIHKSQLINYAKEFGSDELILFIDGKELHSKVFHSVGLRDYLTMFDIHFTGYYHIKIVLLRKDYAALNENYLEYPLMNKLYLLNEWIYLDLGTTQNNHQNWYLKSIFYNQILPIYHNESIISNLNLLNNKNPTILNETYNRNLTYNIYVPVGDKTTEGCSEDVDYYDWQHYKYNPLHLLSESSNILSNIVLILIGDSHTDRITTSLMRLFCNGIDSSANEYSLDVSKYTMKCSNLTIIFKRYMECEVGLINEVIKNSFIHYKDRFIMFTMNCGHHPASGKHRTLFEYSLMIKDLMNLLNDSIYINKNNFVWIESTPIPFCNSDRAVIVHKDWRTFHRLLMFNQEANQIVQSYNYTMIPTFSSLLPFVDGATCDPWHFPSHAMLGVLYHLIHRIKINKQIYYKVNKRK